jgi:hypothetical protein
MQKIKLLLHVYFLKKLTFQYFKNIEINDNIIYMIIILKYVNFI